MTKDWIVVSELVICVNGQKLIHDSKVRLVVDFKVFLLAFLWCRKWRCNFPLSGEWC